MTSPVPPSSGPPEHDLDVVESAPPPQANPAVRRGRGPRGRGGVLGFVGESLAMGWRWLTRMRTALYLLAALALLTLVATLVPQEPNVPTTVASWRTGEAGPGTLVSALLDALGTYDVYGSPLFLALLLLLVCSLTACVIPRVRAWVRLVRRSRPPLVRGPGGGDLRTDLEVAASPDEVLDVAHDLLRRRRWRLRRGGADEGRPAQVAAEKGLWTREGGSLAFHLSFYVLLLAIVAGQLLTFEGQRGVVEGERGFTDTAISYASWLYKPGRWFPEDRHRGWRMELDEFHIDWIRDLQAPGVGQPTEFRSEVTITPAEGEPYAATIESNHPLRVEGMKITQLDWGYALRVVVEVDGEVVFDDFVTGILTDGWFYRTAVKAPAAEPDVGLEVFFYPYAPDGPDGRPVTTGAPWPDAPMLLYQQWRGDLQLGATQQSVNQLDTSALTREGGAWLRPGQSVEVGGVTVSFPEVRRWVGYQVSLRPQLSWLLVGSALLVAGLVTALYAYRRRLWILVSPGDGDGRTLVTVAGRAFQRPDVFVAEHAAITTQLREALGGDDAQPPDGRPPDGRPTGQGVARATPTTASPTTATPTIQDQR